MWPENWPAFVLFNRLGTQWNVGFGGPVGLRYEALYPLLDRCTPGPDDWSDMFEDVRVLESAALGAINNNE